MTRLPDVIDDDLLEVSLACRPVYNRGQEVVALDLLVQGEQPSLGATLSDIEASSAVILGTYTQLFQDGRMQRVPGFLKVTDEVILAPELPDLPKDQYILEVPEGMLLTSERVEQLKLLAQRGYRLAMAGYDPDDVELDVLVELVHIVKVDTRQLNDAALDRAVRKLRANGVKILADKVDNREQFERCADLGFDYYQGNFLSAPTPIKGKKISGNKVLLLQLLSELHSPEASPMRLEQIALKDANLTYRILKVVNSAAMGLRREVRSLSHAIALVGLEEIKRWANLFLVSGEHNKPEALTRSMLVRGRMCEVLAEIAGHSDTVNYFIVGLLSQLDALMDISMPELMEQVPLSKEVKSALLARGGSLGEVLGEVERYEQGLFDELTLLKDTRFYEAAYRHAIGWAQQVQKAMSSAD
ncbi:EAL and HDOD domain-containing protein [Microbulbifer thermotolerans]|uniref:Signal protein n=1 Tax=Microbulbifer thermotolerans TaxID=252514 RepID=A0A143HN75_MICTH|nr:HDOD domain-containing protein [Microbulbifer thermotolerans]AMX03195.1 signal protein [Microbulbifer thermotolerans]MCX2783496.1 HDOD domain-containing protein [Microbulbifer thermotolerans]MCX2835548.1 HDOD domain-containing protein [Microbulbifer thermotolerans]WKT59760.1 HDOD domain-containing protein [Microbulbifer thermotolerans]SFC61272.1 EAL and modified HD-GYP domain-containing signal transduction protein [Microbulbifer thermotolerans]